MARVATGIDCTQCGLTSGHFDASGNARCDHCGRFAKPTSEYCAEHDVNVRELRGRSDCPYCRREADVRQREEEMQRRRANPQMHNHVDAQANAIDQSRNPSDFM